MITNPARFADKKAAYEGRNPDRPVEYQIEREIYARRQALTEKYPRVSIDASDKIRFFSEVARPDLCRTDEPASAEDLSVISDEELDEQSLYPVVRSFLADVESVVTKRIRESASSNRRGKNGNKWLHPDIVGMHVSGGAWNDLVKQCAGHLRTKPTRIISVEVKKTITASNVRLCFFQTVSNSMWANNAYLAATEVVGEQTWRELQMLCALHGVGYIRIDADDPGASRIAIPSVERRDVDWESANRIAEENKDFREFLTAVLNFLKTGGVMNQLWT